MQNIVKGGTVGWWKDDKRGRALSHFSFSSIRDKRVQTTNSTSISSLINVFVVGSVGGVGDVLILLIFSITTSASVVLHTLLLLLFLRLTNKQTTKKHTNSGKTVLTAMTLSAGFLDRAWGESGGAGGAPAPDENSPEENSMLCFYIQYIFAVVASISDPGDLAVCVYRVQVILSYRFAKQYIRQAVLSSMKSAECACTFAKSVTVAHSLLRPLSSAFFSVRRSPVSQPFLSLSNVQCFSPARLSSSVCPVLLPRSFVH